MKLPMFLPRIGLALILTSSFAWSQGANLIPNGDFEDDSVINAEGLPKGVGMWNEIKDIEVAKPSLSTTEKVSGNHSLSLERVHPKGHTRLSIAKVPVEPGKRYYFAVMVKSTEGSPGIFIRGLDANSQELEFGLGDATTDTFGASISFNGSLLRLPTTASENPEGFNKLEMTFTAPDQAAFLAITVDYGYNMGTAWFDDFELLPLD